MNNGTYHAVDIEAKRSFCELLIHFICSEMIQINHFFDLNIVDMLTEINRQLNINQRMWFIKRVEKVYLSIDKTNKIRN